MLLRERSHRSLREVLRSARATYRKHAPTRRAAQSPPVVVRNDDPDVVLDIPKVRVDEIELELKELQARVALDVRVLDLLDLHAGVDAALGEVKLDIKGVEAEALLKVRLDNLAAILDRVMDTVDHTPTLIEAFRSKAAHERSRKPLAGGSE